AKGEGPASRRGKFAALVASTTTGGGFLAALGIGGGVIAAAPLVLLSVAGAGSIAAVILALRSGQDDTTILVAHPSELRELSFPMGHPLDRVVYVGHPGIPNKYYTVASFHRDLFMHKISEVVNLLVALGAQEIFAEHASGWSTEFVTHLS